MSSRSCSEELRRILCANPNSSLVRAVLRQTAIQVAVSGTFYILQIVCALSTPVIINRLLLWISDDSPEAVEGVLLILGLATASVLGFVLTDGFERRARIIGIRARASICGLLYEKALATRLAVAQGGGGSGELHNLFSVDATALESFFEGMLRLVLQLLEIAGILALLVLYVQWGALGGLLAVLTLVTIVQVSSSQIEAILAARAVCADNRARDLLEMLLGSKAIKLRAWEERFQARINSHRAAESVYTARIGRLLAITNVASSNGVDVVSVCVITIYVFAMGERLTPSSVFTYWVLLGLLHGRIFNLPVAIKQVKEGLDAFRRLDTYLRGFANAKAHSNEISSIPIRPLVGAIDLANGCFSWITSRDQRSDVVSEDSPGISRGHPVLVDVSFNAQPGSLSAIVGSVGTGKTSLLLSLLGETLQLAGTGGVSCMPCVVPQPEPHENRAALPPVTWPVEPLAYVPQTAWILRGSSIRENIVFGRPWDAERYACVIRATALGADLKRLPHGDLTLVSTCTLSGGQKQRISIARAAYGYAPIVLLDDCLSALDGQVGQHVLEECIVNLMAGRTRVFITCTHAVLSHCDTISVMLPVEWLLRNPVTFHQISNSPPQTLSNCSEQVCQSLRAITSRDNSPALALSLNRQRPALGSAGGGPFTIVGGPASDVRAHSLVQQLMSSAARVDDTVPEVTRAEAPCGSDAVDRFNEFDAPDVTPQLSLSNSVHVVADVTAPKHAANSAQPLSFIRSFVIGVGGVTSAAAVFSLLLLECIVVIVGVYWLSLWSSDSEFSFVSRDTYMGGYVACVVAEVVCAYLRQLVYASGTLSAADALHRSLVFRVTHAPQSFFDSGAGGVQAVMAWLTHDLDVLDRSTWYNSEYFLLAAVYSVNTVAWEISVTPWVLLPAVAVAVPLVMVLMDVSILPRPKSQPASLEVEQQCIGKQDDIRDVGAIPKACQATSANATGRQVKPSHSVCCSSRGPSIAELMTTADTAKAPLLDHFGATLEGLESIRAYNAKARFTLTFHALMDAYTEALLRLEDAQARRKLVANMFGCAYYIGSIAVLVPLHLRGLVSAAGAGFMVVLSCFASYLTSSLVEHKSGLEALMGVRGALVANMRSMPQEASILDSSLDASQSQAIIEAYASGASCSTLAYSCLHRVVASSADFQVKSTRSPSLPKDWPTTGRLAVRGLQMRYTTGGTLVLRGVNIDVQPGTRVAVVGRTGAGKSSLLAAILRLVEPCGGTVEIDGVDVSTIPLRLLRQRVCVISQDPLFFTDTLRRNLDPFGEYPDAALLSVLDQVGLLEVAAAVVRQQGQFSKADLQLKEQHSVAACSDLPPRRGPLDALISERGANLSLGQQQLLAIARALLCTPRLLLLDEAYAAVDADTESELHALVCRAFRGCTVLQVAHRLHTVVDSDEVVVMSDGVVIEHGAPRLLLQNPRGAFRSMVDAVPEPQRGRLFSAASTTEARPEGQASGTLTIEV